MYGAHWPAAVCWRSRKPLITAAGRASTISGPRLGMALLVDIDLDRCQLVAPVFLGACVESGNQMEAETAPQAL